ncbi:unnamed protein product [Ilex paraguariensis]|uniref:Uncharacterized protein n=1 Tax=Ilex paraguariensis TaxID=185542 RepID=A0ABC8RC22_9AQUA
MSPIPILISKIMEDCGVVIHSSNTYFTLMNPIYSGTIKKRLGQRKKKKTHQPKVDIENEVEVEDEDEDEAPTKDVPNSSTASLPPFNDLPPMTIFAHLLVRLGRKMDEFGNTKNEIKESLK